MSELLTENDPEQERLLDDQENADSGEEDDADDPLFEMGRMDAQSSADDHLPDASLALGLRWAWAHEFAIQIGDAVDSPHEDSWHAGKSDAIAAAGPVVATASRSGGLWLINPAFDAIPATASFPAQPLSLDWDNPDVSCLAWESASPQFLFVGCWHLESTGCLRLVEFRQILGGLELVDQWSLPYDTQMGTIAALVALETPHCLVAATDHGVWWTPIPTDPSKVALYVWAQASGLPDIRATGLAEGPNGSVVTAGYRVSPLGRTREDGIFVGTWGSAGLTFTTSSVAGPEIEIGQTSLSSCAAHRDIVYAVTDGGANGGIGAVLRSPDGGSNWTPVAIPPGAGNQGAYNNCIAAHPTQSDTVVLGWRDGPFLSQTGGTAWTLRKAHHGDLHALTFTESGGDVWLYVGTDGGLALTSDLGETWDTRYNKHLLNLEFYGTLADGDTYPFDVSPVTSDLFGGGTQDNGNLWCHAAQDTLASFHRLDGGDGATVAFLADGTIVRRNNTILDENNVEVGNRLRTTAWLQPPGSSGAPAAGRGDVIPATGLPDGLPTPAVERVQTPSFQRGDRLMLAVAGKDTTVYGLFEATASQPASLEPIAHTPSAITCVASLDGTEVLAGTRDGIFLCTSSTGATTKQDVAGLGSALFGRRSGVQRIIWTSSSQRFAIANDHPVRWDGSGWALLPTAPSRGVFALHYQDDFAGGCLFAATDAGILASTDLGSTWSRASQGLPRRAHARNLVLHIQDERRWLYLATYGWGIWRTELPKPDSGQSQIPLIEDEMVKILFGIIQDGDGVEILPNGTLHPVPPREPARQLAAALLISGLARSIDHPEAAHIELAAREIAQTI